jgi:hypothetical protein
MEDDLEEEKIKTSSKEWKTSKKIKIKKSD